MSAPRRPKPGDLARHWRLDPGVVYLNHGSFGACPAAVLEAQRQMRDRIEAEAVSFYMRDLFIGLDRARADLAPLIGCEAADLVFLPNATTAVATIAMNAASGLGLARPAPLGPGDEILACSQEYPACLNILRDLADRCGAALRIVHIPVAPADGPMTPNRFADAILAGATERTRLCLLSLITSPGGLVTPAARIIRELDRRGIATILDAAHGPGAIPIDLAGLAPAFFTSNAHKWLCAPKGAAILYVRPDLQPRFMPLVLSNYEHAPDGTLARSRFNLRFDYIGTDDPTPRIAIADAVEHIPAIAGDTWDGITARNRAMVLRARNHLLARLGTQQTADDRMVGPMALIPLPRVPEKHRDRLAARPTIYSDALQDALFDRHGVQVPVWRTAGQIPSGAFDGARVIRISAQLYNSFEQYEYLADALAGELQRELG